tara:strand:- start:412 stop:1176 length:765 start_codon:yes stop_codon:yes gene_type:complete
MDHKIIAIIQARSGSTRLPGKVLLDLQGKSVIQHVADRVSASKLVDKTYVATTLLEEDLAIVRECSKIGVGIFCGSKDDVLDRYYQLAKIAKPKHIVRITADCPVIDPQVIDHVITKHLEADADYTSNTLEVPYPDGQDVEVFKFSALNKAWKSSSLASEREHVTPYIKFNEDEFKIEKVLASEEHSKYRWTLDEIEDFKLISIFYDELYSKNSLFSMKDILELHKHKKSLFHINSMHIREEGYRKSLENDKVI